ncbi:glycosyltransferase family 4 protein [Erythrobacter ani]|uniref:glycosyltransferase family 4 protein n=1 Tax=Erythrobacter ani TaxID=2827235 RepID=UPI002105900C|nr:glycosyltransferase [Erythrobacter ani]
MSEKPDAHDGIPAVIEGEPLADRHILIVVENLPLPFDRRVWQEARTLKAAGAHVSIICPTGQGYEKRYEVIDSIEIHRHSLPLEAKGPMGFLAEYGAALFWETVLAWRIFLKRRFDVIQGCNPPDLVFLVALPFKFLGVRYIFDHHDINPELYEAKFGKRGFFWKLMLLFEKMTFKAADVSIATNESYRKIAVERGGMPPDRVHVVRSGPDLSKLKRVPPANVWKNGRAHMIGYVGVMGEQEGIDLLIEAAEFIVCKLGREDIQFVLVGSGPALKDMRALTKNKGLEDFVTFTGRAPDDLLLEILSTMDVGVNPDRVNAMNDKSTMNKIMEFMSSIRDRLPIAEPDHVGARSPGLFDPRAHSDRPREAQHVMARSAWYISLFLVAALTISVQLDRQSAVTPYYADLTPEPFRSFAQAQIAARALAGSNPAEAVQQTRKLVARRPLPAEPLRMLAQAQMQAGHSEAGFATIQISAQRGWRDPAAQEAMMRIALAADDQAEAARRYAALLVRRGTSDQLLEEFGEALFSDPTSQAAQTLTDIVAGGERWQPTFLRRGVSVLPAASFAAIVAQSAERGASFDCGLLLQTTEVAGRENAKASRRLDAVVRDRC